MSYVTQHTEWPSSAWVADDIRKLIASFYETADSKESTAGLFLAEKVFSHDGVLASASGSFTGFEEISKCRDNAWGTVTSRKHQITRVYAYDSDGHDLALLGLVQMTLKNGAELEMLFSCQLTVERASDNAKGPRIKYMRVYADSAPVTAALKTS